jgi:hypothetical protein
MDQNGDGVCGQRGTDAFQVTFTVDTAATPDIRLSARTVAENAPAGTLVGTFTSTALDANDPFTYTLVSGDGDADNAAFSIDAAGDLRTTATFDFETRSSYSIRVRGTDQAGLWRERQFTIAVADAHDFDSPGLFDAESSAFYLRNSNSTGAADYTFGYGDPSANWTELVGDWNGDGTDSIGFFDPVTCTWYLRNSLSAGYADYSFGYGSPALTAGHGGSNWQPLVGDWDGNGTDTVGFFDPATCTWYLRNSLSTGYADCSFGYGSPELTTGHAGSNWQALVGDWDGNGTDTIGFFDPATCTWYLRNTLSTGVADYTFAYGAPSLTFGHGADNWQPLVGDWDGNGTDTIGFYAPHESEFMLRNALATGAADVSYAYGAAGAGWRPLVGCWTTAPQAVDAALEQLDLAELDASALTDSLDMPLG